MSYIRVWITANAGEAFDSLVNLDIGEVTQHMLWPIGTRCISTKPEVFNYSHEPDGYKWVKE